MRNLFTGPYPPHLSFSDLSPIIQTPDAHYSCIIGAQKLVNMETSFGNVPVLITLRHIIGMIKTV